MKVTGILSISNGIGLQYPFPLVVHSLQRMCDKVIVGVDPEFTDDRKLLEGLGTDNTLLVDAPWDRTNRCGGTEIARQMDRLVNLAHEIGCDWVVILQADELFHDDDFKMLRAFMERYMDSHCIGLSTERQYYWKDLNTIRTDWGARIVRIFKPTAYSFLAEGTSKDGMFSAPVVTGDEVALPYLIHHYSRVDSNPELISKRIRNLDTFFHPEGELAPEGTLPTYDFVPREYDNFSKFGPPPMVKGQFKKYIGTHPIGVSEWYRDR